MNRNRRKAVAEQVVKLQSLLQEVATVAEDFAEIVAEEEEAFENMLEGNCKYDETEENLSYLQDFQSSLEELAEGGLIDSLEEVAEMVAAEVAVIERKAAKGRK